MFTCIDQKAQKIKLITIVKITKMIFDRSRFNQIMKEWFQIFKILMPQLGFKFFFLQYASIFLSLMNYYRRNSYDCFSIEVLLKVSICCIISCVYLTFLVVISVWVFNHRYKSDSDTHDNILREKSHFFESCETRGEKCTICLSKKNNTGMIQFKKCKHVFHRYCIYEWINTRSSVCVQCPCCREPYILEK